MRKNLVLSRAVATISGRFIGAFAILLLSTGSLSASIITIGQPAGQTRFEFKNTEAETATDLHITLLSDSPPTFADPPNQPQLPGLFEEGFNRATVGQDLFGRPQLTLDLGGGNTGLGVFPMGSFNLDFSDWAAGTKFDLQYSYPPPLPQMDGEIGPDEPDVVFIELVVLSLEPEPGTLPLLAVGGGGAREAAANTVEVMDGNDLSREELCSVDRLVSEERHTGRTESTYT